MLLRTSAYREAKGFDERFFMYCEDVDLCLRLQIAGWKLQVATDTIVHHEAQRDSHSSLQALVWHLTSFVKLWTSEAFWKYLRMQRRSQEQAGDPSVLLSRAQKAAADLDRGAS
jgi:N-acetylglucosaminyl-diphospho-decaprenol L-rhamnosyltransferase